MEVEIEKVINRQKLADAVHEVIGEGVRLLRKDKFDATDHAKMKVMRTLGPHINAGVAMMQQETAMVRAAIVAERMKQLGFGEPKQLG